MEQLYAQLASLLLGASRAMGIFTAAPILSTRFVPFQVRVALSFVLGLFLIPAVAPPPGRTEGAHLLLAALLELVVGLVIGFLCLLVVSVMQIAGAWIDLEMGFSLAGLFDPLTGESATVLGNLFQTTALVFFLAIDGHHGLIRALARSYALVPAGGPVEGAVGGLYVARLFGELLGIAMQLILPFVAAMLLTMVAFAVLNRAVAQLNIFAIGLGTKTLVGLLLLILMLPFYARPLTALFEAGYAEAMRMLDLMRAATGG
ncbi:flagellar biosynthetic protein FliR [Symbiobacterium terraclitae]|uniref:flagellar biosynthetic protein FliR n=1 Tax=Symbiobacterium terraclitae TaxID=557451 RepID=UPI0035B52A41